MSRYVVRVCVPNMLMHYLSHGRLVSSIDNATHYPHPSAAKRAMASYREKCRPNFVIASVADRRKR